MALHKEYFSASSFALFSKGVNIISALGLLWFANVILGKQDFGLFMMALSLCFCLSLIVASGFKSLVLYHASRKFESDPEFVSKIVGQAFWISLGISLFVAGGVYICAPVFSMLINEPDLSHWMRGLALFVPANSAVLVLPNYSRGRQRVRETLFFQEICPNILRCSFVCCIWLSAWSPYLISYAYILSAIIPVLILFLRMPVWPTFNEPVLSRWDVAYGLKSKTFQILNQPFRGLDVLLVGALSNATIAADYAMATRLSQLLWVPKHAAAQLQVPRMGALLEKGNKKQLGLEYNAMRSFSFMATLFGAGVFLLFAQYFLSFFGAYESALPALYVLSAAAIIRALFGSSGDLVAQAGHMGESARIAALSMLIIIFGAVIMTPLIGALGGAYAILFATLQLFIGFEWVLRRKESLNFMPQIIWVFGVISVFLLILPAHVLSMSLVCGLLMVFLVGIVAMLDKSWMKIGGDVSKTR